MKGDSKGTADHRRRRAPNVILLLAAAHLPGCFVGTPREETDGRNPGAMPLGRETGLAPGDDRRDPELPSGPLALADALRLALEHHPALAEARSRVEAATGRKVQAGLFPNPVASATMESAPFSGRTTGEAEYPLGVMQPLPVGGRLGAAEAVAEAEIRRLRHELEAKARKIAARVRGAFGAALFAERALSVEREVLEGAEETVRIVRERSEAGDVAPDALARAELEAARTRLTVGEAELAWRNTLIDLEDAMGLGGSPLTEIEGELEESLQVPALESLLDALEDHPGLAARGAAIEEHRARILREEALRIPDLDVGFFYRRVEPTDTDTFDVGIALELPVFDRRQGKIREARAALREAREARRRATLGLAAHLRRVYGTLEQDLAAARRFREEIFPRSRRVLGAAEARFRAGETSLAQLIPVRRDHRQTELDYLRVLREIALGWAELRSLASSAPPGEG